MTDPLIVRRKLNKMIEYLGQLVVENATDINGHLIVSSGHKPPADYYTSFVKLSDCQILDKKFAKEIAPSAGLRNRLVHEYEEIDDQIVYKSIQKTIESYTEYIKKIENYLKKVENSSR